ncbi:hypothetical protein C7271_18810 [filamentous cyanobacterium CCP5]|nr:hypothetical protein C7271_18810 [filamentous cyanobacterium CCP5]
MQALIRTEVGLSPKERASDHFTCSQREATVMSLKYRGINYEQTQPAVEVSEEVIGLYRGAVATRHNPRQVPAGARPQGLTYRGAKVR